MYVKIGLIVDILYGSNEDLICSVDRVVSFSFVYRPRLLYFYFVYIFQVRFPSKKTLNFEIVNQLIFIIIIIIMG